MHSSNSSNENFFWDKDKNDLQFLSLSYIDIQIYCTPVQPAWGDSHCEACVDVLIWQHSAILTCWQTVTRDLHSVSSLRSGEPAGWFDLGNVHYGVITRATGVFPLIMTQSLNPAGVQKKYIKKISLIAKQLRLRDTYESLFLFFTVKELFKTVWCSNDDIVNALCNRS